MKGRVITQPTNHSDPIRPTLTFGMHIILNSCYQLWIEAGLLQSIHQFAIRGSLAHIFSAMQTSEGFSGAIPAQVQL